MLSWPWAQPVANGGYDVVAGVGPSSAGWTCTRPEAGAASGAAQREPAGLEGPDRVARQAGGF